MVFKAHAGGLGPKLGESLASGPTALERRVELARARVREEELARRALARGEVNPEPVVDKGNAEQGGTEQGTGGGRSKSGPKGGRPLKYVGKKPWEVEGVSRRTWQRRRQGVSDG